MGAKKGMNNAVSHQVKLVQNNTKLIEDALFEIRSLKGTITNEKDLVKLLVDKTGLHRTTFTRKSSKYRKLVLGFLNTQPGSSGNIDLKSMDIETLRIHAMTQQLELEEYKSELSKLNRKIKKLSLQKTVSDDTRFAETAMALMMVLERLSGVVSIDFDKQEIHDMTKYDDDPDRVIVKGHRAEPFFQLIHSEPDIFGLPSQEQKALSHE